MKKSPSRPDIPDEQQRELEELRRTCAALEERCEKLEAARESKQKHLDFEHLLMELSTRLISAVPDRLEQEIVASLGQVAGFFGADVCSILKIEDGGEKIQPLFTFAVEGISVQARHSDRSYNLKKEFPWLTSRILSGETISISRSELPEEAAVDLQGWLRYGNLSVMVVPIMQAGALSFHITLSNRHRERTWSRETAPRLKLFGENVVHTLERKESEEMLQKAEAKYRTVANFTVDWEYWELPDGSLNYISPSCERVTGYSPEQFIENPSLLREITLVDDLPAWDEHRRNIHGRKKGEAVQFRIRHRNDTIVWLEHICQPIVSPGGESIGVRASNRDITKRMEAKKEIERLNQELAHTTRVATMGELAASISHELNQPLCAIQANAQAALQLLSRNNPDFALLREIQEDILADNIRAQEVIVRTRSMIKKEEVKKESLDINILVKEVIALVKSNLALGQVRSALSLTESLPPVFADRTGLQQALLNLVLNALDAAKEQEVNRREIIISTGTCQDGRLRISVRDQGRGLALDKISTIFEPFFSTKTGGLGMGLAISRSLVEECDGEIAAENNSSGGATFHIYLPVHCEAVSGPTVYLVDDEESVRKSLERLISTAGFNVLSFASAAEFLNNTPRQSPCCLLVDVQMPGIDGLELQQELNEKKLSIPIIFITGHSDIKATVEAMQSGAVTVLSKPLSNRALFAAIEKALAAYEEGRIEQQTHDGIMEKIKLLTPREMEVFNLLVGGLLNKQVAAELGIKERTVKFHRSKIMAKLEADSAADLVRIATQAGLMN